MGSAMRVRAGSVAISDLSTMGGGAGSVAMDLSTMRADDLGVMAANL